MLQLYNRYKLKEHMANLTFPKKIKHVMKGESKLYNKQINGC